MINFSNKKLLFLPIYLIISAFPIIFLFKEEQVKNKDITVEKILEEVTTQVKNKKSYIYDRNLNRNWQKIYEKLPSDIILSQEQIEKSLINIKDRKTVDKIRQEIINYIWNNSEIPKNILPKIQEIAVIDKSFKNTKNLKQINKLKLNLKNGIYSVFYHFIPLNHNGDLIIYHQGHTGSFTREDLGKTAIEEFIKEGFAVMAFSMPLIGTENKINTNDILQQFHKNPQARYIIDSLKNNQNKYLRHEDLEFFATQYFNFFRFFLDPVLSGLNHVEKFYNYQNITMVGLSGGGWTTTLYAAIDPRIKNSYPVAGSLPLYLRGTASSGRDSIGDIEQLTPDLYNIASYLDLYILGSLNEGNKTRKSVQILNQYDPCCFAGLNGLSYSYIIKNITNLIGGSYDLIIDNTHFEHKISDYAIKVIIDDIVTSVK